MSCVEFILLHFSIELAAKKTHLLSVCLTDTEFFKYKSSVIVLTNTVLINIVDMAI